MYSVLCSLLTVVIHVTKARGPVARSGKLYPYRSQRATPDASNVMAFDIEEDSVNEKQFLQRIASRINSESHGRHRSHSNTKAEGTSRTKRSIFGPDNRINVGTSVQAQRYPYSTVVTLSSGCTGTLIGAQHVLTAAHCVHDGKRFLSRARKLKIGMLQSDGGFRWIKVRKIHLPKQWIKTANKQRIKYDYAVLRLKHPHKRPTMAIKASDLKRGATMQFAGFHSDKISNTMWYSQCEVMAVIKGAVFNYCDCEKGISGSGVRSNNAVVGVVSAVGRGRLRGRSHAFNVVITLTPRKVRKILKWMKRTYKRSKRRRRI